jgi:phosphoribosylformimino-5-aminoimidazole carboxamide ribotide isomerase
MTVRCEVIPAVDVLGDESVRLVRGAFSDVSTRAGDPAALAASFAASGARMIHVVDLDGARTGSLRPALVARIAEAAAPARVQASGGIRSVADAEALLDAGAARVVVGTAAFVPGGLERFAAALGPRLVVAVDVRDGRAAVAGWERASGVLAEDAAEGAAAAGVTRLLCTAIDRDGTLGGPDVDLLGRVRAASGLPVLAAGGISSAEDVEAVAAAGCEAAIVGRALLDGALPLSALSWDAGTADGR